MTTTKIAGYNVYRAPDGDDPAYIGRVTSLRAARALAALAARDGLGLSRCDWASAEAAGHLGGQRAPDRRGEAGEPAAWFGRGGWYCAVAVRAEQ